MLKNYLQKLKQSGLERKIPNISEQNAEFIGKILAEKNPKNILEIGTANGYSALSFVYFLEKFLKEKENSCENSEIWKMRKHQEIRGNEDFSKANYLEENNWQKPDTNEKIHWWFQIFTIEYAWNAHNEAIEHFKNCKIKNIFPIWGDAKAILPGFAENFFDVIYIDAMKKEYLDYFLLSLSKAKNDAIFIIDDVEKFAHKMQNFYDFLHSKNIKYALHKTDEDDSIMIIERKNIFIK